jgi:hypothetical protein
MPGYARTAVAVLAGWGLLSALFYTIAQFWFPRSREDDVARTLEMFGSGERHAKRRHPPREPAFMAAVFLCSVAAAAACVGLTWSRGRAAGLNAPTPALLFGNVALACGWAALGFAVYRGLLGVAVLPALYPYVGVGEARARSPIRALMGEIAPGGSMAAAARKLAFWKVASHVAFALLLAVHVSSAVGAAFHPGAWYLAFWRFWPWA